MSSKLPLKVLSQAGPILCWIEGAEGLRFPETWQTGGLPLETREQAWLLHELPTYSYDNVDEIVHSARGRLNVRATHQRRHRQPLCDRFHEERWRADPGVQRRVAADLRR